MDSLLSHMQPCSSLCFKPTLSSSSLGAQTPRLRLCRVRQGTLLLLAHIPPASLDGIPGRTHRGLRKPCRSAEEVAPNVLNLSPGDQTLTKATLRWEQVPSCDLERILCLLRAGPMELGKKETPRKTAYSPCTASACPLYRCPFCKHLLFFSRPALILSLLLNTYEGLKRRGRTCPTAVQETKYPGDFRLD